MGTTQMAMLLVMIQMIQIQIRSPMRFRTLVPPAVIRELAANAIRDAQSALKQLAADGVS